MYPAGAPHPPSSHDGSGAQDHARELEDEDGGLRWLDVDTVQLALVRRSNFTAVGAFRAWAASWTRR